ncbi:MAG: sensor histidine kinase [Actinomycetales bacterium]|nr:sensor histidine kinase [Actinomycetales bacterium]
MSDPERLEAMTRASAYVLLLFAPFMAFSVVADSSDWHGIGGPVFLGTVMAQFVAAVGTLRTSLDASLARRPLRKAWLVALAVATSAALVVAVTWFPGTLGPMPGELVLTAVVALAVGLAAVAPLLSWRVLSVIVLAFALAWGGVVAGLGHNQRDVVASIFSSVLVLLVVGFSMRSSVWMIRVFWEQEHRREVDARLAVAEERLGFSRDLHDTVGRTLATVAVKSELAAELATRGKPEAAHEMLEVRQIAEDALREMRELVAGFRAPDLEAELAGARSLLDSAGIAVSVTSDDVVLPAATQESLAWVVREAITNVVRHADASRCVIDLRVVSSPGEPSSDAVLTVTNDGAHEGERQAGNGLRGLTERLGRAGGALDVTRTGEQFRLEARVPFVKEPA